MASGSAIRTYRYLRLGLVATMVVIVVAVAVDRQTQGSSLTSISAYYYTGARTPFVGALFAASLALIAIAGTGFERMILNIAAIFAPIIALVPTPLNHGAVAVLQDTCDVTKCVPSQYLPDIEVGVYSYVIVGALAVLLLIGLILAKTLKWRPTLAVIATLLVVLVVMLLAWTYAQPEFLRFTHYIAALGFFGLIGVVAIYNAFNNPLQPAGGPRQAPPPLAARIVYIAVPVVMTLDAVWFVLELLVIPNGEIFWPEIVALAAFVAFWLTQTFETVTVRGRRATIVPVGD